MFQMINHDITVFETVMKNISKHTN